MAKAVVIGGGVGGLAAGVALRRKGWDVTVLERAPMIEPVGSGLAISANALKALDAVGLGDRIRALSAAEGPFGVRRSDGRWMVRATEADADADYGDSVVVLLRATLMEVLLDALGHDRLLLGTAVKDVDADRGVVRTEAGDLDADLVVAADGIHSATRRALFPGHPGPAYSGVTAWRGLVPRGGLTVPRSESWGRGTVFGVHLLAGDVVYFYATDVLPAGTVHADEREELLRRFGGWHQPIPALLRAADPAMIIRNDIHQARPLPAFHRGRVALVGDAAHAMTPNLGQGACQAIEDGVVLAHVAGGDLAAYSAARVERTTKIVQRSMTLCRMSKIRNPAAVWLRDAGLSAAARLSPGLMLRSMDELLRWRPPGEPAR
ncbi:2-polyprenyl-6-methoxyphenol hydroxylase-like FAD-dependent oxidoreductase [Nonomuraea fuscirosea]|uniref:2-polyprenyl-6-methoxyphenol hydroxylase-like FAD-dependent oxidoreductase n=1 Tax=Nonomuraea fuscirosea TaxID=1291556 RepID=A0A2T0MLM6_9ACTN|nr:FAD-dependent monooxygenase [Nonomuraea fuscirosea]PRX58609.1 2-polyprenyl-6-methoxyphenol hydroxylase-like FAD-dependent oxidoreductase [Nonomuraea fuscirosea]